MFQNTLKYHPVENWYSSAVSVETQQKTIATASDIRMAKADPGAEPLGVRVSRFEKFSSKWIDLLELLVRTLIEPESYIFKYEPIESYKYMYKTSSSVTVHLKYLPVPILLVQDTHKLGFVLPRLSNRNAATEL